MLFISLAATPDNARKLETCITREQVEKAITANVQLFLLVRVTNPKHKHYGKTGYYKVRENGRLKTWKRDTARWAQPVKYGLRDCYTVTNTSIVETGILAIEAK